MGLKTEYLRLFGLLALMLPLYGGVQLWLLSDPAARTEVLVVPEPVTIRVPVEVEVPVERVVFVPVPVESETPPPKTDRAVGRRRSQGALCRCCWRLLAGSPSPTRPNGETSA